MNNCFDCKHVQNCREFDSAVARNEFNGLSLNDSLVEAAKVIGNICMQFVENGMKIAL